MRTMMGAVLALGSIGVIAIGTPASVCAQYYYPRPPPPDYQPPPTGYEAPPTGYEAPPPGYEAPPPGFGYRTENGCPPNWTVQGGACKPYRYGPWDRQGPVYGGNWNGCPPNWTVQVGVCKPYRYGPWDNPWYR